VSSATTPDAHASSVHSDRPGAPGLWALAATLCAALVATFWALEMAGWAPLLLAVFLWAAVPGVLFAWRVYGGQTGALGTACLIGPVWGFALTSLVLLALWTMGLRHWSLLVVAPVLASVPALLARRWTGLLAPVRLGRRDLACVLLVLLIVPVIVGRPYSRVGADVEDGRAYRAYFTADFVWKMAVVTEVAKGTMPPRNQFLGDRPLHYYWLPHLLSAVEYRALEPQVRLDRLLLVNAVLFGLAFTAFLYAFTRHFVGAPGWAAAGIALAVFCSSFEGLERLVVHWREGLPLAMLRNINIDAVTRWFYGSLPIDGLQRLLLYQPQHHAAGYATGLSAILVLWRAREPARMATMVVAGTCLAACVLLSAFSALMIVSLTIPVAAFVLVRAGKWRALVPCAIVAAVPVALAGLVAVGLSYASEAESLIEIGVHRMAVARLWPAFPVNFGAAFPAMAAGLLWMAARRDSSFVPLVVLVGGSFFYYFFVNVRDVQDVYVGWRAGHLLLIATAPLAGYVLHGLSRARLVPRVAGFAAAGLLALAALPTVVIDLYNTQDIENRSRGPGFRWTIVLSHAELEALDWIRANTHPAALVQVEPTVRAPETWSYIPTFAERRMAAGLPLSMVPLDPYQRASERMRRMFSAGEADEVFDVAVRNGIDYLVVAPPERHAYPHLEPMLDEASRLFPLVFRNAEVSVYQVGAVPRRRGE
jgi:hypothetical protein